MIRNSLALLRSARLKCSVFAIPTGNQATCAIAAFGALLFASKALSHPCESGWVPGTPISGANWNVSAIAVLNNGDIVAGGGFRIIGGIEAIGVARWDGHAWNPLGPTLDSEVRAFEKLANGDLVAIGPFEHAGDLALNHVGRWNGVSWSPLGTGLRGGYQWGSWAIEVLPDGRIIAAGDFTSAGDVPVNRIASWDGSTWSPLGPGLNGRVSALKILSNGDLIAGGEFTAAGSVNMNHIARWDGNQWSALGPGTPWYVRALELQQNGEIIAGCEGTYSANVLRWNGQVWTPLGSGFEYDVNAVAILANGDIIAGGGFTSINGVPLEHIARWDGAAWQPIDRGFNRDVDSLCVLPNGDVIAGGWFTSASGIGCANIARWDGRTWSSFGAGTSSFVNSFAVAPNGDLVAGGEFAGIEGVNASQVARWNGVEWSALGPGIASPTGGWVLALTTCPNGDVIAGGNFGIAGYYSADKVAIWNGFGWLPMGTGMNEIVTGLTALPNGDVIAVGGFTTAGGVSANNIARWDGTNWHALGTGIQQYQYDRANCVCVMPDGELVVGGKFSSAGGVSASNIARWNGSSWRALGSGTNDWVVTLALTPSGALIAGGDFSIAGGLSANHIARWNGTTWSPLGTGCDTEVYTLSICPNGDVVAAGGDALFGGSGNPFVSRWNGAMWSSLGAVNGGVEAVKALPNGDIVIGGVFNRVGSVSSGYFARYAAPAPPSFSQHPADTTICTPRSTTLSISAPFADYHWQYQLPTSSTWFDASDGPLIDLNNIARATLSDTSTANLHIQLLPPYSAGKFCTWRCIATNDCGSATSNDAALFVCIADFNCDSVIDFFDYLDFVAAFAAGVAEADFNRDGAIDFFDYLEFVDALSAGC